MLEITRNQIKKFRFLTINKIINIALYTITTMQKIVM